jgi:hypothetical protein
MLRQQCGAVGYDSHALFPRKNEIIIKKFHQFPKRPMIFTNILFTIHTLLDKWGTVKLYIN